MADVVTLGGEPFAAQSDPEAERAARDLRGKVLGRMLALVSADRCGVRYFDVFHDCLKTFDMKEEQIGPDIIHGAFFLDRVNLLRINTLDPKDNQPSIGGDTILVPTLDLRGFMAADLSTESE